MALIALAQMYAPGVPVLYGGFTSNVDMRTGSPAFGTPEYAKAALASGQLARRYKIPFRSSNVTASNCVDVQAAYEGGMSLWGTIMGGVNLIEHAAGWLEGGLTASFEKLILDAEMLQLMREFLNPLEINEDSLGSRPFAKSGPAAFLRHRPYPRPLRARLLRADALRLAQFRELAGQRRQVRHRTRQCNLEGAAQKLRAAGDGSGIAEALDAYVAKRKEDIGRQSA
jgi:trimethylamine--corrinoid protein Co-methyltransferase